VRQAWSVSIRKVCDALRVDRSLYHYKGKRGEQADLKLRIKQICETRVRYGYRRVHVLLRREGWDLNPKRIYRLYKEMGLQLRNKVPKRRVKAKLRDDQSGLGHGLRSRPAGDGAETPHPDDRRYLLTLLAGS
jgi:putative transposase